MTGTPREVPPPSSTRRPRQPRTKSKPAGQLDAATRKRLLEKQDGVTLFDREKCGHCGGLHLRACPRVKRLVFAERGDRVVEVEFWPPGQWPEQDIIWPEQVFEDEGESQA